MYVVYDSNTRNSTFEKIQGNILMGFFNFYMCLRVTEDNTIVCDTFVKVGFSTFCVRILFLFYQLLRKR